MDFTPEILRQQAQRLTDQEVDRHRDLAAVYLRGSLLYGSPLLGGAGDIDLVFIHQDPPVVSRTIRPLTPEIHFDISHHPQSRYTNHRSLRVDPWLGPALRDGQPLYDPKHLFDYTQSGVRGLYTKQDTLERRARPGLQAARQFWLERQLNPPLGSITEIRPFLAALDQSVNSLALLTGRPLPLRRLGLEFPNRISPHDPELLPAFVEALGAGSLTRDHLEAWYTPWMETLQAEKPGQEADLLQKQTRYLGNAVSTMVESGQSLSAVWPLLVSWTDAVHRLPGTHPLRGVWREACGVLGLAGNEYQHRLEAFDHFLDRCEQVFSKRFDQKNWA